MRCQGACSEDGNAEEIIVKTYALYRGDTFLELGSKIKLANFLGCSIDTISYYLSKAYQRKCEGHYGRRIIVIEIEEEGNLDEYS